MALPRPIGAIADQKQTTLRMAQTSPALVFGTEGPLGPMQAGVAAGLNATTHSPALGWRVTDLGRARRYALSEADPQLAQDVAVAQRTWGFPVTGLLDKATMRRLAAYFAAQPDHPMADLLFLPVVAITPDPSGGGTEAPATGKSSADDEKAVPWGWIGAGTALALGLAWAASRGKKKRR